MSMATRKGFKPAAVALIATMLIAATLAVGVAQAPPAQASPQCFTFTKGWEVTTHGGDAVMGKPGFAIKWCRDHRVVTSVPEFWCWDSGGWADFNGCKVDRGGLGYESVGIRVKWRWSLGFNSIGLAIRYYCLFAGFAHADGSIGGTINCDYGTG